MLSKRLRCHNICRYGFGGLDRLHADGLQEPMTQGLHWLNACNLETGSMNAGISLIRAGLTALQRLRETPVLRTTAAAERCGHMR